MIERHDEHVTFANAQDIGHPASHDYEAGSPHLRHRGIRDNIVRTIRDTVLRSRRDDGPVRVLEVGAGHGSFTDHIVALGADVTVTEMSSASAEILKSRYRYNQHVHVLFDRDGDLKVVGNDYFDVVICVSVLHHIPDYLSAIATMADHTKEGGSFLSFQDPLWYPRRSRYSLSTDRIAFYCWRLTRGDLIQGAKSFSRRLRNAMDDSNPRDTVEYHVLRKGCDERAIADKLARSYQDVVIEPYWSTPAAIWQRLGERLGWRSTFSTIATNRRTK